MVSWVDFRFVLHHFLSRTRLKGSWAQLWPDTAHKQRNTQIYIVASCSESNTCFSSGPRISYLTFRLIFDLFVEFLPTRESFGVARGPRFWALGVDSGPRGVAFEGIWDPPKIIKHKYLYWCPNGAYDLMLTRLELAFGPSRLRRRDRRAADRRRHRSNETGRLTLGRP